MGKISRAALLKRNYGLMKNRELFEFKHFTNEHTEEAEKVVNYFATTAFVHDSMKLQPEDALKVSKWYVNSNLLNGLSVGVFDKETGKLVGLSFISKESYGKLPDSSGIPECYQEQDRLKESLQADIISGKPAERGSYMKTTLVVVLPEYAKYGVASELTAMAIEIAKSLGCYEIGGSLLSPFVLKISLKSGFQVTKSIRLVDYVDSKTGLKPFTDAKPPHDSFYWVNQILLPEKCKL